MLVTKELCSRFALYLGIYLNFWSAFCFVFSFRWSISSYPCKHSFMV